MAANDKQIGGDHYKAKYQCWDFAADVDLQIYLHPALKYLIRHKQQKGKQDLEKAIHYIEKEKERELCSQGSIYLDNVIKRTQEFLESCEFDEYQYEIFDNLIEYRKHAPYGAADQYLDDAIELLKEYIELCYPEKDQKQFDMFELGEN